MSNWKHAYGWSGHILTSREEVEGSSQHNVIAVPDDTFARIVEDHEECTMDERIHTETLGVEDADKVYFLACGVGFSAGWKYYGTPFIEAELRAEGEPLAVDQDAEYLRAMKEIYGLDLPPCRLMVGCSTEH